MGRPKIVLSDEQVNYLRELAVERRGAFDSDVMRLFKQKFPDEKVSKLTLQRRFEEIWISVGSQVPENTSNRLSCLLLKFTVTLICILIVKDLPNSMSSCSINEIAATPSQSGMRRELSTIEVQSTNKRARAGYACFIPDDDDDEIAHNPTRAVETPSTPIVEQQRVLRSAARRLLEETPVTPSVLHATGSSFSFILLLLQF